MRPRCSPGWRPLLPLGLLVVFARYLPEVAAGATVLERHPWAPRIGLELTFRLDGLSLTFALLITGIGTLVTLYAGKYLESAGAGADLLHGDRGGGELPDAEPPEMTDAILHGASAFLIVLGALFMLIAAIGVARMPDCSPGCRLRRRPAPPAPVACCWGPTSWQSAPAAGAASKAGRPSSRRRSLRTDPEAVELKIQPAPPTAT